jgi:hypothetical protein
MCVLFVGKKINFFVSCLIRQLLIKHQKF